MKSRVLPVILSLFLLSLVSFAQSRPGGGGGVGVGKNPGRTGPGYPNPFPTSPRQPGVPNPGIFLSGKVVIDDGSALTEPAEIVSMCYGQQRNEAHTDSRGAFSFEFMTRTSDVRNAAGSLGDAEDSLANPTSPTGNSRELSSCELRARAPGFVSEVVELGGQGYEIGNHDLGRIVLHRIGQSQGMTVSATTAAAPKSARKAYAKGLDAEKKGKFDEAEKHFSQAVEIYPKYAIAWNELGRIQRHETQPLQARHSFDQAVAADSSYADPYEGLTLLAANASNWQEVAQFSSKLTGLDPVNFPDGWYFNAWANLYLKNIAAAEKSAREGLRIDDRHRLPKLEYVMGIILAQKGDYAGAAEHMQNYEHLARTPTDIAEAQKQLDQIQRMSASTAVPGGAQK